MGKGCKHASAIMSSEGCMRVDQGTGQMLQQVLLRRMEKTQKARRPVISAALEMRIKTSSSAWVVERLQHQYGQLNEPLSWKVQRGWGHLSGGEDSEQVVGTDEKHKIADLSTGMTSCL